MEQTELRQLEDQCIQEYPPTCMAACPIHVDVRTVLAYVSQGDFTTALKILKKTLPFPGIIGRICDHPCQDVCKRAEVDHTITIAALERACADFGTPPPESLPVVPPRGKRVAIIGGGLSGLTAAFDLARKGYTIVIFEAAERLGGRLWNIPDTVLPRSVLLTEIGIIETLKLEVRLNTRLGQDISLTEVTDEFDAVYLGTGNHSTQPSGLELNEQGQIQVEAVTFATAIPGVFAGGSLIQEADHYSPIQSISSGRRAAISIDRYCQKVSLTASRQNEGSTSTRLYTNTAGIEPLPVTPMSGPAAGYTEPEAVTEARRCLQCECMECVKVCEYLDHFGSYPRKYIRQIYNNLSIVMGNRQANKLINSCSLCNLCAEVCPEELSMGAVCRQARQTMVEQERMPPSAHEFALRDMEFSNSNRFALARHQPGAAASQLLFFPGCQLSASSPGYIEQIYAYLREKLSEQGQEVGLMLRCCGAPADWAGRKDLFQTALAELKAGHEGMDRPRVILACSSCYQIFKTHLPEIEIVSLWELLAQLGLPSNRLASPYTQPVSIHDPCATRYEKPIQDSVRRILDWLGCQVEELPLSREKTECCSYGGLMWLANPELAQAVIERRIAASSQDYVTYCAMCRDFFVRHGKPTLHLLDLIFAGQTQDRATTRGPGYSQRHENRTRLKQKLLKELWGEEMTEQRPEPGFQLMISEAVQESLEKRLILLEDIQQVLDFAERTGQKLFNQETGHFLASYRPANVTYWVEYSQAEQKGEFIIHNAYSHRMEIVEDTKS